jgi:hypothetical protein
MKSQSNKGRKCAVKGLPKRRDSIPADDEGQPLARQDGETPHWPRPTQDEMTGADFIDGLKYSDHQHYDDVISAALHALATKRF